MPPRSAAFVVAALLLSACPSGRGDVGGPTHFACHDGRRFAVVFDKDDDFARFVTDDDSHVLARVGSASGARYTDGRITLFTKGRDAMVEIDGAVTYRSCRVAPPPEE